MDGKMKTGIKMRVTLEQREKVVGIANAHGLIRLSYSETEGDFVVLYPKNDGDGFAICDTRYLSFESHDYEEVDAGLFIRTNGTCELPKRDENGQIRGLWITDVPLTEEAFIKARRIVGYKDPIGNSGDFIICRGNWLIDDGGQSNDAWFYSWSNPESRNYKAKLTYQEFLDHYDTEKADFPALEELEWVHVDTPEWWSKPDLSAWMNIKLEASLLNDVSFYKDLYENSKDFKVTWQLKQKEPHAELRKEFEEERERGEVVQVFRKSHNEIWHPVTNSKWHSDAEHKLIHYKFNPTKALAWSYREGGVFIECNTTGWAHEDVRVFLLAVDTQYAYFDDGNVARSDCSLNIDKEGNVNLSNGTTVNIYTDGLIDEWFDEA